ncbi:MAG: hypothetical protein ABW321_02340 [Polyangiales bacterium]
MSNWIREAEAALTAGGRTYAENGAEVTPSHAPPILDATGARALLAPFFAAFMWAALVFREQQAHSTLEPLALGLRVLAYALTLRALRVLFALGERIKLAWQRRRYALVVSPEGLFFRAPDRDVVVPRENVLNIKEQAATALGARSSQRWAEVYVVTHPDSGRLFVTLPPIFGHSPRALAEQLMRWRGAPEHAPLAATSTILTADGGSEELPSRLWERVAAGEAVPGVVPIRHGNGWLKGGPYASMLLGLAVLDGYVRLPAQAQSALDPTPALLLAAALVFMPLAWAFLTRASLRKRRGLSLVLTPSALLSRSRGGSIVSAAWNSVSRIDVFSRSSWSLLKGAYDAQTLVVQRKREANVQCTEVFLAVPVEVAAGLCEAYKRAAVSATDAEVEGDSQSVT